MDKKEVINKLILDGKTEDVRELIEGESQYTTSASQGVPQSLRLQRLWVSAVHHLRFISEFGLKTNGAWKDGKYYAPFVEDFNKWLDADAHGIAEEDIFRYLRDHPLE